MNGTTLFVGGLLVIWIVASGRAASIWKALLNPDTAAGPMAPGSPAPNPYPNVPPGNAGPTVPPGWS